MILVACISCGPITINFRDGCYDLLLIYYNTITGRDQFGTKTSKITNHQYQSGPRLQKSQITSTNSGPTPTFIAKMTYFRFGTGNFGTGTAMSAQMVLDNKVGVVHLDIDPVYFRAVLDWLR